eukprot:NODE_150_length_15491_cov_0.365644.p4 type:complete len:523 gc:universal NODE_150_length_15491_cov_0.365644:5262-3694(-)
MTSVYLYVYDLSHGMAKSLSSQIIGKQIDAIYHTSIVIFNMEVYYGQGICTSQIKKTPHGHPIEEINMGETQIDFETFKEFIQELNSKFTAENYHLLNFNCNTFTNECCHFLLGKSIPERIINLPSEFLSTPMGQMLQPMISQMFSGSQYDQIGLLQESSASSEKQVQNSVSDEESKSFIDWTPKMVILKNDAEFQDIGSHERVLFFFGESCAPCQLIKPHFKEAAEQFPPAPNNILNPPSIVPGILINTSTCRAIASKYQISAIPTIIYEKNGKIIQTIQGADIPKLKALWDKVYNPTLFPNLVGMCEYNYIVPFNQSKNLEKLKTLNLSLGTPKSYESALNVEKSQWYLVFDNLRYKLLSDSSIPFTSLLTKTVEEIHAIIRLKDSQYTATILCGMRVLVNMINHPNSLLYPTLRNALMEFLPDALDCPLIKELLHNISVWIGKRRGLKGIQNQKYLFESEDMFVMEMTSILCEFYNKTKNVEVLWDLAFVVVGKDKELVHTMISADANINGELKQILEF